MDVLTAVLFFMVVFGWLAVLGRQTQPAAERVPVGEWHVADLVGNIAIGYTQLVAIQVRPGRTGHHRRDLGG